jgi:hypothetical protein
MAYMVKSIGKQRFVSVFLFCLLHGIHGQKHRETKVCLSVFLFCPYGIHGQKHRETKVSVSVFLFCPYGIHGQKHRETKVCVSEPILNQLSFRAPAASSRLFYAGTKTRPDS